MRAVQSVCFAVLAGLGLMGQTAEAKDKWVCMKDQSEVKVAGKNPKEKEKDCVAKGGIWEKSQPASTKQSSGSGGAW